MDVVRRHQYHLLYPAGSVGKSGDMDANVPLMEAMKSAVTARLERAAQCGHAGEERRRLGKAAQIAH
ncbi:hypothetical protein Goshw_020229 [Gossypium schwendimanii]|uniref:Uncharacterized protein n=1 Tax=Gossypium schwendimanii TaxID=34291 RepID=A0A7J9MIT9_GOSSC|nr:hypothetical protein [Gossypium schwendimanii]